MKNLIEHLRANAWAAVIVVLQLALVGLLVAARVEAARVNDPSERVDLRPNLNQLSTQIMGAGSQHFATQEIAARASQYAMQARDEAQRSAASSAAAVSRLGEIRDYGVRCR